MHKSFHFNRFLVVLVLSFSTFPGSSLAKFRFFKSLKKALWWGRGPILRQITDPKTIDTAKKVLDLNIDNFHTVEKNNLYRSKQLSCDKLKYYITKYNIKTVINLRGKNNASWWHQENDLMKKLGLSYINIPMRAVSLPNQEHLIQLLDAYSHAPRPILIHCHGGADRTGEAAAIWALDQQNKTIQEALLHLSPLHGHLAFRFPAKTFLIQQWQGRSWAYNEYDPKKYPEFYKKS